MQHIRLFLVYLQVSIAFINPLIFKYLLYRSSHENTYPFVPACIPYIWIYIRF